MREGGNAMSGLGGEEPSRGPPARPVLPAGSSPAAGGAGTAGGSTVRPALPGPAARRPWSQGWPRPRGARGARRPKPPRRAEARGPS